MGASYLLDLPASRRSSDEVRISGCLAESELPRSLEKEEATNSYPRTLQPARCRASADEAQGDEPDGASSTECRSLAWMSRDGRCGTAPWGENGVSQAPIHRSTAKPAESMRTVDRSVCRCGAPTQLRIRNSLADQAAHWRPGKDPAVELGAQRTVVDRLRRLT
jgi:hypothetical protein